MADQHDFNIADQSHTSFRADLNSALLAAVKKSNGATAPGTMHAYQEWADTTSGTLKRRNAANSSWIKRDTLAETFVLSRSSNTVLAETDFGRCFVATAVFTQTLTAAATLGDGWYCHYRNDSSGIVTIDPDSSELIDGASSITLYPGETCVIWCNGTAFRTIGRVNPVLALNSVTQPNLLINGNWLMDQINEGALYTSQSGSATFGPDGWLMTNAGGTPGVLKMRRIVDPDNAALKCLEITCTTADAAVASSDFFELVTSVEGFDAAGLMWGTSSAVPVTLRFKAKFNVTGVYGISVANAVAQNRNYVGIITVPDANENEYSLTIPGDTTGTWDYVNGVGMYLRICLMAGTGYHTTAWVWGGTAGLKTTSAQANFMSSATNIGYIKRIQLIPGSVALAYGPQDIQKELAKCQRYYWKTFDQGVAVAQASGTHNGAIMYMPQTAGVKTWGMLVPFPVPMRAAPTATYYNPVNANAKWFQVIRSGDSGSVSQGNVSAGKTFITNPQVAGDAASDVISVHGAYSARLS